jgi:signal transduction histidine kinase
MATETTSLGVPAMTNVRAWWPSLSLARQFTLASSALVVLGLGILGMWVSAKIEAGVKSHVASRTALYMGSVVAPHLQELASRPTLSAESSKAIDQVIAKDAFRMRVVAAKIWARDGAMLYATQKELVGARLSVPPELIAAWNGDVTTRTNGPHSAEVAAAVGVNHPLLEIYVPVRRKESGEIIAVAEFYEVTTELEREQANARRDTWVVTALVSLTIIGGLYLIVAKGSRLIESQRASLSSRVSELSELLKKNKEFLKHNEELRQNLQEASRRSAESEELQLRRLGSDLHDGPAQLLAVLLMRLDGLFVSWPRRGKDRELIRSVLKDAIVDIRHISNDLALPEIDKLSVTQALMVIAAEHERRTGTTVSCEFPSESIELARASKLCLCRFVQEGLTNAYKHAGGVGQRVILRSSGDAVVAEVLDQGPGIDGSPRKEDRPTLGLVGLRNRLESVGGRLDIVSAPGMGTRLTAHLAMG